MGEISKHQKLQGHGAGLAVVYFVIEQHFGNIRPESEEARGTTIFFTLGSGGSE
jgi:signal transduction histidine kinase